MDQRQIEVLAGAPRSGSPRDRLKGRLEVMKARWIAGFNTPGYMPDSEPSEHTSYREARDSLIWWLERFCDEDCEEQTPEQAAETDREYAEAISWLKSQRRARELSLQVGNLVFWIVRS